jgi:hypothetical protein
MKFTVALTALAAVAYAAPQATSNSGGGVTAVISPTGSVPAGAQTSYAGAFEIAVVNITSPTKRDVQKRQSSTCGQAGYLTVTLANSQLTDSEGRTGYIASNYQFQFDKPPQAGAIYTAGFSVLQNGSLALGPSAVFYECSSGGFYNLYDRNWAPQCEPILIEILPCSGSSSAGVLQTSDGQPQATTIASYPVSQISDGQPQAATAVPRPVTQISDGQIQQPTGAPVSQISDGQIQATSAATLAPVSQISDGQIQATSAATLAPVSQISDGQIQATSAATLAPVSQISDGQIQATSAATLAPVSQISDGQIQATSASTLAPVSQISDGQIQATPAATKASPTGAIVTQIGDGQIQAGNATSTPVPYTGAGNALGVASSFAIFILGAAAALL